MKPLNFSQMDELINRWTQDVVDQEQVFLRQANEVNAWDRVLRQNSNKLSWKVFFVAKSRFNLFR